MIKHVSVIHSAMASLTIPGITFILIQFSQPAVTKSDTFDLSVVQASPCEALVNITGQTSLSVNLSSLQRNDGVPRFMTEFETLGETYNYSFNPCSPYSLPLVDPHNVFGDGCHSVAICKFSRPGGNQQKDQYFPLGLQANAVFQASTDSRNITAVNLVFTGYRSMRWRKTVIELVCDTERRGTDDGLFIITEDQGVGDVKAQLHHVCCCPDGCVHATNQTGMSQDKGRTADRGIVLIMVGTILALVLMAAIIGGLCYIKRSHVVQLQIYDKLPGPVPLSSLSSASRLTPNMENSRHSNLHLHSVSSVSAYRDYEPVSSTLRKKLLPVLDDSIIPFESIEMGQRLGGGIFGDTHLAEWMEMTVALKRLTINIHGNQVTEGITELMKREVWFLSRQRHKNIVAVLGLCIDGKHPCIVTDYVSGGCLKDFLKVKGHSLTWPQRIQICCHVADGVAFLHSTKPPIIHRDLRCGNLFLSEDDTAKVADFGLTKMLQPLRQQCTLDDCCCRRQYSACPANIRWTAPEVLLHPTAHEDDAVITMAADVYSFGLVMWELFMCQDPFEEIGTEQEVIELVTQGERPQLTNLTNMMHQYKDLMQRCWSQLTQDRPTMKQVAFNLKEIQHQARSFQKTLDKQSET